MTNPPERIYLYKAPSADWKDADWTDDYNADLAQLQPVEYVKNKVTLYSWWPLISTAIASALLTVIISSFI